MTEILRKASAGTLESSDAYVEISPSEGGLALSIDSIVMARFGEAIEAAVQEELSRLGVSSAAVRVLDRGALDCVIRARVEAAVLRAGRCEE